jgi:hypothetical protein
MAPQAAGPRLRALAVEDCWAQWAGALMLRRLRGPRPLGLEPGAPARAGCKDRSPRRPRQLETACQTAFVPAFVPETDDSPPGLRGIGHSAQSGQSQRERPGAGMALEQALARMVVSLIASCACDDAAPCSVVKGPIELLHVAPLEHRSSIFP